MKHNVEDNLIIVCGTLCNYDLIITDILIRYGFNCVAVRYPQSNVNGMEMVGSKNLSQVSAPLNNVTKSEIVIVDSGWQFYKIASKAKLIISITGSVSGYFGKFWFLTPFLPLPPTVFLSTGSDLGWLILQKTIHGKIYKHLLSKAKKCLYFPYPVLMENIQKMSVINASIINFPYLVLHEKEIDFHYDSPITFLHATSLSWSDAYASKGSDRFIRAFIRVAQKGADIRCIILDRGPQKEEARQIIENSDQADKFEWRQPTSQAGLVEYIKDADIVADQFDIGGFGASAMEAMALGRPVLIFIDKDFQNLVYNQDLPVLNCHTEDEIQAAILSMLNRKDIHHLGKEARDWVYKNHSVATANFDKLVLEVCLAAGIKWPLNKK